MLKESLQSGIDGGNNVFIRDVYEHIESETYSRQGCAFQVLWTGQKRATGRSTTGTLTFRNVFTNMS